MEVVTQKRKYFNTKLHQVKDGNIYCWGHRAWEPIVNFNRDRSSSRGYNHDCRAFFTELRASNKSHYNQKEVDRKKNDPQYQKAANGRSARWALIFGKGLNQDHHYDLIGCSIAQFRSHIESQFVEGMSWVNYGRGERKWCFEDYKPLKAFDLIDLISFREAFNWRNCQPMWHLENLQKNIEYSEEAYQQRLQKYK